MIQLRRKGSHGVKGVGRILGNDCWGLKENGDEVEGLLPWAPAGTSSGAALLS